MENDLWVDKPVATRVEEGWVGFTPKRNVAYFRLEISLVFSPSCGGQKRQKATIQKLCSQLEHLAKRLRRGSRGFRVGWIHVCQGGIERAVAEMLSDQEGISA